MPVAGALSPAPGEYDVVFDTVRRAGAGSFTFRYWVNDTTPPSVRLLTPRVSRGGPVRFAVSDRGSGVYPRSLAVTIDGRRVESSFHNGVVRAKTFGFAPGRHRFRLRVSDYQETRNTENVGPILPNTRFLTAVVRVR